MKYFLGITLAFVFATAAQTAQWTIIAVEPTGDRWWGVKLQLEQAGTVSTSATTTDLVHIQEFFKVEQPAQLVGKTWVSDRDNPFDALDLLRVVAINGGSYTPPDGDDILDTAATALAQLQLPNFERYDYASVEAALSAALATPEAAARWSRHLAELVAAKSNGTVQLAPLDPERLEAPIVGTSSMNMLIVHENVGKPVAVTSGRQPFVWMRLKG